jgi:hypothetical protein
MRLFANSAGPLAVLRWQRMTEFLLSLLKAKPGTVPTRATLDWQVASYILRVLNCLICQLEWFARKRCAQTALMLAMRRLCRGLLIVRLLARLCRGFCQHLRPCGEPRST